MSFLVNTQHIIDCTCNCAATFVRYFVMDVIHPDNGIDRIKYMWFLCLYFRKYTVCNGTDCIWRDSISEILFHPVADFVCAVAKSIQTDYTICNTIARIVSRFLMNWGSKLELRSRGMETVTSPNGVWTYFCILPLRRFPLWRSSSVRWASISPSKAAFNILSNRGAKAPSLPNKLLTVQ